MALSASRQSAARGRTAAARWCLGLLLAALGAGAAHAVDYLERITTKASTIYVKNNRARVILTVFNGNTEMLDIEVACEFFAGDKRPAGRGHNTVSRLAPRRSDTVEVTDEMAVDVDSVRCAVTKAVK
jgi:hypothetical protein